MTVQEIYYEFHLLLNRNNRRENVNIDIPEGYIVETLPKSTQLNMEENIGGFKFVAITSGNKIQLTISHQINTPVISTEYYPMMKDYYQGLIAKETEKIVLKKV